MSGLRYPYASAPVRGLALAAPVAALASRRTLLQGIWAYFILLILEGALRKWLLPGLSTPLLIIRDPIALWLLLAAWQRGFLPMNLYIVTIGTLGIAGIYTAVFLGHGSLPVALFGARILLIHLPLMFVIGNVLTREDVTKIGRVALWMVIPMTILIVLQFFSPQSAWVNRGVGGDISGAGYGGAGIYLRPSGLFSFTNGVTLFYGFVSGYLLFFWTKSHSINRLILLCATICLLAAIPFSMSRGLFFQFCTTLAFLVVAMLRKPKFLGGMILVLAGCLIITVLLSKTSFFQTAVGAFTSRFESASDYEKAGLKGVLVDRFLGGMVAALGNSSSIPFFGYGLGMGTNIGSMFLAGRRTFLISEEEWGRVIGELGTLMGLTIIFLRISLCSRIAWACYQKLVNGDMLPWMLLSFGLINMLQGGWAQPTSLGFCVLSGGLLLAALRDTSNTPQNG